jgi:Outer membrane protein beta-barrel domain
MRNLVCRLLLALLVLCLTASAQTFELNGGYTHITGDQGVDGFSVGTAVWFTHRVSIAADYDDAWDTSTIGQFELTQTGLIVSKSHLQNFLVGPRIFFPGVIKSKDKHIARLLPFGEAQFGVSHLNSTLEDKTTNVSQSASDNAFSWMLGGGADYRFSPHWVGRVKLGFLRTHLAESGQSRLRLSMGVAYTFGKR